MLTKKIFLHICCAPCSIEVIDALVNDNYEIFGYFYNPNIHPVGEYEKRKESVVKYLDDLGFQYEIPKYNDSEYFNKIGDITKGKERCTLCYDLRMGKSAKKASELGFDVYSSTLLFNPHKDFEFIAQVGKENAKKNGLTFLFPKLAHDYWRNKAKAKELGLYFQKYCGCKFSILER